jgi:predicted NBD/HSP70 family sugar kinase
MAAVDPEFVRFLTIWHRGLILGAVDRSPSGSRAARSRQNVVRLLRERGALSRAEIARAVGLSRSTVSALVADLVEQGVVLELGTTLPPSGGGAGRPGAAVMLNPDTGEAIGLDFGRRHIHVIIADVAHEVRIAKSVTMPEGYRPAAGLAAATDLVRTATAQAGTDPTRILGVGVSLPALVRRAPGPGPRWAGVPVAEELSARLGLPVLVENDATLGALAERRWGAGRGYDDLVYLKLHTRVGAALFGNGALIRGAGGGAGRVGHLPMDPAGPQCRCGGRGCLESLVGIGALMRSLEPAYGDRITLRDVITMAWQGDPGCVRAFALAGERVGRAVGILRRVLDPQVVIVGGALAGAGELLLGPLREAAGMAGPPPAAGPPAAGAAPGAPPAPAVLAGSLGPQASALGAVALVLGEGDRARPAAHDAALSKV